MNEVDIQDLIEVRETLKVQELRERIDNLLRMLEKSEMFEVTEHGKVIAHFEPTSKTRQSVEQRDAAAWADLKRIAAELAPYWSDKDIDSVEIVRDVRRDL